MKKKKIFAKTAALIMALAVMLCAAGCGQKAGTGETGTESVQITEAETTTAVPETSSAAKETTTAAAKAAEGSKETAAASEKTETTAESTVTTEVTTQETTEAVQETWEELTEAAEAQTEPSSEEWTEAPSEEWTEEQTEELTEAVTEPEPVSIDGTYYGTLEKYVDMMQSYVTYDICIQFAGGTYYYSVDITVSGNMEYSGSENLSGTYTVEGDSIYTTGSITGGDIYGDSIVIYGYLSSFSGSADSVTVFR